MRKFKLIFAAAALCGGLTETAVSAMPAAPVSANTAANVEQVYWVCGYGQCWWRPGYYYGGYYGWGGNPYGYYGYPYGYRGYYYPRRHYYPYWRRHYR